MKIGYTRSNETGIMGGGVIASSPLTLSREPQEANEASTKNYINGMFSNINVMLILPVVHYQLVDCLLLVLMLLAQLVMVYWH